MILSFYYKLYVIHLKYENIYDYKFETPVSRPKLYINGSFNKNFTTEFWLFILDRFSGPLLQETNNVNVYYNPGNRLVGGKVMRGKAGFFYYVNKGDGNNLKDFLKQNLVNQNQLNKAAEKIKNIMNFCTNLNISFLLVIGPNKHSVYSEYFPIERPPGITRADQLSEVFKLANIPYIFSRDYLIEQKKKTFLPLYYETDTHWNYLGGYFTFQLIKQKIKEYFPNINFPDINYTIKGELQKGVGDIVSMSKQINKNKTWCTMISVEPPNGTEAVNITKVHKGRDIKTKGPNKSLPRATIFRDSFFTALEPLTSPLFSEAEYYWTKFDTKHVLQFKPDLVIFEMVERYSPYFF